MRLNVGGRAYEVARDTLTGCAGMLRQLVDGSLASSRDTKGRLRLSLDGRTFRYTMLTVANVVLERIDSTGRQVQIDNQYIGE